MRFNVMMFLIYTYIYISMKFGFETLVNFQFYRRKKKVFLMTSCNDVTCSP